MKKSKTYLRIFAYFSLLLATLSPSCAIEVPSDILTPTSYISSRIKLTGILSERNREEARKKIKQKNIERFCEPDLNALPERLARWKPNLDEIYSSVKPQKPLNKCFIYSVMNKESAGYHTLDGEILKSTAGAIGLMQLLPSTARNFVKNPSDPKQNLEAGIKYLNSIVNYLRNNYPEWDNLNTEQQQELIFASYNMGEGGLISAAERAEKKGEKIKLPPETRKAIEEIKEFYEIIKPKI